MNETEVNIHLLKVIFKNKKGIFIIAFVFLLISIGLTSLMDKKYTASGIVFPTKSNLMKNVVQDPGFGFQIHTDRLTQIFESQTMRREMVNRFNLIEYYELDTLKPNWLHHLKKKYDKDISINRTKYLSIEIQAELKDPVLAANIVNNMISYVDTIRREIFLENTQIWVRDLKPKIAPQKRIVDSLLHAIQSCTKQQEVPSLAKNSITLINARRENGSNLKGDELIQNALEHHYSIQLETLISEYYLHLGILNRFQTDLINGEEKLSLPFPKIFTVMNAEADHQKTSPSQSINGLVAILVGLVFGVTFFVIKDNYSQLKERLEV